MFLLTEKRNQTLIIGNKVIGKTYYVSDLIKSFILDKKKSDLGRVQPEMN